MRGFPERVDAELQGCARRAADAQGDELLEAIREETTIMSAPCNSIGVKIRDDLLIYRRIYLTRSGRRIVAEVEAGAPR
jgi:hypothetical protein